MTNRFRVASSLSRRLRDVGLAPGAVLREASLPIGLFNEQKILLTTEKFFALYRGIAEASGNPAVELLLLHSLGLDLRGITHPYFEP
jgi:hypothetical protein